MKRMMGLLMALLMMFGACASAEEYVLGPFSFDAQVQLEQGATALQLVGEGVEVKLSSLPAMSLPRVYAEMMDPADLMAMVLELVTSTFENAETFEMDGGLYGSVYTDGEDRVAHYVCGLDMLYVTCKSGENAEEVLEAVRSSIAYNPDAEPVKLQLPMGSMIVDVPADWYLCAFNGTMAEFAPQTGSVGVQVVSAEKLGVDLTTIEGADAETAAQKVCDALAGAFEGEKFTTETGLNAVRYWRKLSETASVLTTFVVNGSDVMVVISSANAGEAAMEELAAACLSGISAAK